MRLIQQVNGMTVEPRQRVFGVVRTCFDRSSSFKSFEQKKWFVGVHWGLLDWYYGLLGLQGLAQNPFDFAKQKIQKTTTTTYRPIRFFKDIRIQT